VNRDPGEKFVSESIKPVTGTADTAAMARGEPGLPDAFTWRGEPLVVKNLIRSWRETGPCKSGSSEVYARKHWFEVETGNGCLAEIYFERQARGKSRLERWWLYSLHSNPPKA